ncbi:glycosyltransferase [Rhodobacterales bacterium HKCCE3408]|nr:glycosyltransferase [Rhodobacterales bacterium HKCCE3408]
MTALISETRSGRNEAASGALRVAFAGGNGFPPEDSGGVQSSTHDLALRLLAQDHAPAVLAPLYGAGAFGLLARTRLKLGRSQAVGDTRMGYPVYRAWTPPEAVADFCAAARPDVAVVQCHGTVPIARAFREQGVPVILYFRNVEFDELCGNPSTVGAAGFIANSRFTASRYRERYGIEAVVVPPTLDPERYAVDGPGKFVTMINPVAEKGVERAVEIAARCPDIPFLFVESWLLDDDALRRLKAAIAPHSNIRFERRAPDVREIYLRTRLLLAPSVWEEAWGRVASEAQCSGIPVIGSTRGGLPEAIGSGGLALDPDWPVEHWVDAVREVWFDETRYASLSTAARAHSERPEASAKRQFEMFLSVVRAAASAGRS